MKSTALFILLIAKSLSYAAGGTWILTLEFEYKGRTQTAEWYCDYMTKEDAEKYKKHPALFRAYVDSVTRKADSLTFIHTIKYAEMPDEPFFVVQDSHYRRARSDMKKLSLKEMRVKTWSYYLASYIDLSQDFKWLQYEAKPLNDWKELDEVGCVYRAWDHGYHPEGRELIKKFLKSQDREDFNKIQHKLREHRIVVISKCGC